MGKREKDLRLSHQALRVLALFVDEPRQERAGSDIARQTYILSGTLYPLLMRLEAAGWLESKWESLDPKDAGRPRRRLYRLTAVGYNKTRAALAELGAPAGRLAWKF